MRLTLKEKKVILLIVPFLIILGFAWKFWYITLPILVITLMYTAYIVGKESSKILNAQQTPILSKPSDSEKHILQALYQKIQEYKELEECGIYASCIYNESDGLRGYEIELSLLRKNLRDIGVYRDGKYHFCTFPNDKIKDSQLYWERNAHYSSWFNEKCDVLLKNIQKYGIEQTQQNIITLSDYLLTTLHVNVECKYIALKLREVKIRYHIAQIKEEQRQAEIEERKAQKDYERALKDAAKNEEKARLQLEKQREALEKAASEQEKIKLQEKVTTLEQKLQEALTMKERALSMAQQTRVGYVYVISNTRSFGEDVYKIGMTRRLEPMDRVRELSDASVPFAFDVHYMIYTDDAPKLESQLHQRFTDSRINADNYRKEFFRVPLTKITEVLNEIGILPNERAD